MNIQKTIIAIGGGELGESETLPIDQAIVKFAKKKHPKALFIPTASNDAIGYWETFQKIYKKKLGCKTDVLMLLRDNLTKEQIEEKILSTDIIYVGGGNTLKMLKVWRKKGVDVLLKKAYEKGVILSGLSAGAICWFRYGASDSRRFMKGEQHNVIMRVRGLNLIPCTISPHHIREKQAREKGLIQIMKRTPGVALALDDNSAILIQDDCFKVLRSKPNVHIRKVFRKNGKIEKELLKDSGTLEELFEKH